MSVELSVIICTYNRYSVLHSAINSIELQNCAPSRFELLIIDNSTDKIGQDAFRSKLDISLQHRYIVEEIPGLSRARNIGVRLASGGICAFLDDDAQADAGWVSALIDAFVEPTVGVVGGPVVPIWPTSRPSWLHPWLEGFLTIVDRGATTRMLEAHEWLAGTNIAYRTELLHEIGGFNETIGRVGKLLLSNEELVVSEKIRALGYGVLYEPKVKMQHRVHSDRISQSWMRKRVFWQVISDMFSNVEAQDVDFESNIGRVLDFLAQLPSRSRGISGLFTNQEDANLFYKQTEALASLIRLLAVDGRDWRGYLDVTGE